MNDVDFSREYGAIVIAELDYTLAKYKVMAGAWDFTSGLPVYNGASGLEAAFRYARRCRCVCRRRVPPLPPDDSKGGLDTFFTAGLADPTVSEVNQSFNAGLTYTGPFADRPTTRSALHSRKTIHPKASSIS